MSYKSQMLYAKSSNDKIKTWQVEADGNVMIIKSGYIDGKISERTREITGKNTGKTNATTDVEQCELEAKARFKKKMDEQYSTDVNKLQDYLCQPVILPMLAHSFEKRKHDIVYPCYVQPKLDGVRCIYQDGKLMSRRGKEFTTIDHLKPKLELLGIAKPDGEIYVHGASFQEIIRRLKKCRGEETKELEYWIYDQVSPGTFVERYEQIKRASNVYKGKHRLDGITVLETYKAVDEAQVKTFHNMFRQQGFEGVIIRNADGLYKAKHRSADLQKYKYFLDAEYMITGYHEGAGSDVGTIVFECKTPEGKVFSVRPKGTIEERAKLFHIGDKLIGNNLTVRYQNLSEDNVPIFPVGVALRNYEG